MTAVRHMLITMGLIFGLIAATGGVAAAATPAVPGTTPVVASSAQPSWDKNWNNNNDDNDHWGKNNNNRDKDHWGWGHRWGGWWGVSAWQCRKSGGWVNWRWGRCVGGKYGGSRIRW